MPYFYNNEVNILFIHVPKTGGTSVEKYFSKKFEIELNKDSLYTTLPKDFFDNISFQHQTYNIIRNNKKTFRIDYENLKVYSIVRNPYTRIMSDLFFKNIIKEHFNKDKVYTTIKDYISDSKNVKHDNHRIPQYLFLVDENNELIKNINIMKTENLNEDMNFIGFSDFHIYEQVTSVIRSKNYYSYLNMDSIKLINEYYDKDFEYFGYNKILNEVVLNYTTLIEETRLSNKFMKEYLSSYLDSVKKNKSDDEKINDKIELDLLNQYNNYRSLVDKNYEEISNTLLIDFKKITN
jgi:hypothetical protein